MLFNKLCSLQSHHHLGRYTTPSQLFFLRSCHVSEMKGVLKLPMIVPTLSLSETMSFEKVYSPIILPEESRCGGRLCQPGHFVSSFLMFCFLFSLPAQIPAIIIISCPRISRRSLCPLLTAHAYERDSTRSEHVWNIARGKRISTATSSCQLGTLSLRHILLVRFDWYASAQL